MSATPTTTTYRAPDGQIIRNVQYDPEQRRYSFSSPTREGVSYARKECFEATFTPILEAEQPSPVITPTLDNGRTIIAVPFPEGRVSDGAHTFDELYEHRCLLFLAWGKTLAYVSSVTPNTPNACWISRVHDNGSVWDGWFVAGMGASREGEITYHLPDRMWDLAVECGFEVLEKAPPYDGHDSFDVLLRLEDFVFPKGGKGVIRADDSFRSTFAPLAVVKKHSAPPVAPDVPVVPNRDNLTFGQALEALKRGERVARAGWNNKGMFLFLLPANDGIPTKVITDPGLRKVIETELGGDTFDAYGSIRMFTADKKILTGWLASQTDMLSEDWCIL